jgi:hypothetical protein
MKKYIILILIVLTSCSHFKFGNADKYNDLNRKMIVDWVPNDNTNANNDWMPIEEMPDLHKVYPADNCYSSKEEPLKITEEFFKEENFKITKNKYDMYGIEGEKDYNDYKLFMTVSYSSLNFELTTIKYQIQYFFSAIYSPSVNEDLITKETEQLADRFKLKYADQYAGGFGIASKPRTPETDDEKEIFERFGQDGLEAIDMINGENSLGDIIDKTGISEDTMYDLIRYLHESNFVKIK